MNIPLDIILQGDALEQLRTLPDSSVQCCITSPPYYGLRDYGIAGQIGAETTPQEYIGVLVQVFCEVRRVLRADGVLFLNLGDSYACGGTKSTGRNDENAKDLARRAALYGTGQIKATTTPQARSPITTETGLKPKDLMMIPARVAIALQDDGWYLRSDIIWHKSNCMPESVTDRPTSAHEHIFLLAKNERYYYDADAIAEPSTFADKVVSLGEKSFSKGQATGAGIPSSGNGNATSYTVLAQRNKRNVWTISSQPYSEAHFATFPPKLIEPMILAGSRPGDLVLDPFMGAGTTALVSLQHGRHFIGIELNAEYITLAQERIATFQPTLWTSSEKMEEGAA